MARKRGRKSRKKVSVTHYEREKNGRVEHVRDHSREQEVRDRSADPSMLSLRRSDDPLKLPAGHGQLITNDPEGQPVTTETSSIHELFDFIREGGRTMVRFKFKHGDSDNMGYQVYDQETARWNYYGAFALTMSPDHTPNVEMGDDGALYFDGFFQDFMVTPGSAIEVTHEVTQAEADEANRNSFWGDARPGKIVRVKMRILPEDLDEAALIIGKAHGTVPRIRFPGGA